MALLMVYYIYTCKLAGLSQHSLYVPSSPKNQP